MIFIRVLILTWLSKRETRVSAVLGGVDVTSSWNNPYSCLGSTVLSVWLTLTCNTKCFRHEERFWSLTESWTYHNLFGHHVPSKYVATQLLRIQNKQSKTKNKQEIFEDAEWFPHFRSRAWGDTKVKCALLAWTAFYVTHIHSQVSTVHSRNRVWGCLPFARKFRKFRLECKWP